MADPDVGIELHRVVHGEQRFAYDAAGRGRRRADRDPDRRQPAPDRRHRHHRHPQRDHRRRPGALVCTAYATLVHRGQARDARRDRSTPPRPTPSPAPTWSATPAPAATATRSTGPTGSPRSVGLPGVIAHGMYTLALAARAVDELGRRPGPGRRARLQVHQAGRGARRRHGVEVDGRAAPSRTSTTSARTLALEVTCGGEKVLGMPEGGRCVPEPAAATTRRCGSAVPPARWVRATTEDELRRRRTPRRRGRRRRCCCSAAAATWWSPTRASTAPSSQVATRGVADVEATTRLRRGGRHGRGRRELGRVRRTRRRATAGSASRRCPASRAASARPRSRTSAPTARRSPRPIASVRVLGPATPRACAPSPPPTAASATAPAGSRPTRPATSCSAVTFQLRLGELGAPVALRRAGPHPRRRAGRPRADDRRTRGRARPARAARAWCSTPADHDTWSAGSFFTNPVLDADAPLPDGRAALAAARRLGEDQRRLADRARRLRQGLRQRARRRLSTKHTLALTNRGGATHRRPAGAGPRGPRRGRTTRFGIWLVNEPVLVGCEL